MNSTIVNYENILSSVPPQQLIIISKHVDMEQIEPLLQSGHKLFGENKVQEASQKWPSFKEKYGVDLHLVGPLQSNKIKQAIDLFDVIQTLSQEKTALMASRYQKEIGKYLKYYIQVNTGEEPQKHGVYPAQLPSFVNYCQNLDLSIEGLMCVPPIEQNPGPHFALLKKLAEQCGLAKLSMGMSQDYKIALDFGANYVRIGQAIFGPRPKNQ